MRLLLAALLGMAPWLLEGADLTQASTARGLSTRSEAGAGVGSALQGSFLWLGSAPVGQQVYAVFRKRFELDAVPEAATLHLFADSRYLLWINGEYVERGPCRFDPMAPEYDTLDVRPFLKRGANAVAVLVHHYHNGKSNTDWGSISGRIMRHAPGLAARLEVRAGEGRWKVWQTDSTWRGTTRTRFLPSPTDRWEDTWASIPDRIDARLDRGDWTQPEFDDSSWERAMSVSGALWGQLRPRAIPRLRETEVGSITLLERRRGDSPSQGADERPRALAAALPVALRVGERLILDAGQFVLAYSVLDLEADAGSELELEYFPNYFDTGRKPSGSYGRVNRYIARAGRQSYMSGDTFGFKYLAVRLKSGQAMLRGLRLVNRLYPFDVAGSFRCNDALLTRLWSNSVQTIRLCSEDAYVDCAVRERTEWMADGYAVAYRATRVALAGPGWEGLPRYGDPRLLRSLLQHIGQSHQPDGRLKAHHPSDRWDIHGYIEDYACLWVQAVREYSEHTGDLDLARELWPPLTSQLEWFLDRRTTNGLVKAREFVYPASNPLCYKVCEGTTLNAYVARALRDAAWLAGALGRPGREQAYTEAARELAEAVNQHLWNEAAGSYRGGILDGTPQAVTVPAAFMALCFDIVPASRRERVQRWLMAHHREQGGLPYAFQFLFEALYRIDTDEADLAVLQAIRQNWGAMAKGETGTVWESFGVSENCHEAGAVPAYFLSAYVLGVRLDGPVVARRLIIQPRLGDLEEAEGTVVTELGLVSVRWKRGDVGKAFDFEIQVPPGTRATVALPRLGANSILVFDGRAVLPAALKEQGRSIVLEAEPGPHRGRIAAETPTPNHSDRSPNR